MIIEPYNDQKLDVLPYIDGLLDDLDRQITNLQRHMFEEN